MGKAASSVPVNHAASVGAGGKRAPTKKLGKRKGGIDEAACFYCKGKYNAMGGVGPHFKQDCPKRKHDMALGVGRKDIHSEPKPLKTRKTDHARVQKVQPAKQEVPVEIPMDAASLRKLSNSQSDTTETTSKDLPATPERDSTPDSPVVSSGPDSDSDEDMDNFDCKEVVPVNNAKVASAAEALGRKAKAIEDTVSQCYPFLLKPLNELTENFWVLDTGCGHGLTGRASVFVAKSPNDDYMFTFGQGSKLRNTHLGIKNAYYEPNRY
ncbi:unnamed protein product [Phytophthora fragariaefolia]|uniref:Unnamed protein product n=1 Tax=Phytophthora fragariaefolia TaxID=1490495 RepID=A0A9W6Y6V9_9STRA|nr:unnamed protein product [Phytophthora fragariaefolia]